MVLNTLSDPYPVPVTKTFTQATLCAASNATPDTVIEIIKTGTNNQAITWDYDGAAVQQFTLSPSIACTAGTDYLQVKITTAGGSAGLVVVLN
jgi:hypothetical protein